MGPTLSAFPLFGLVEPPMDRALPFACGCKRYMGRFNLSFEVACNQSEISCQKIIQIVE